MGSWPVPETGSADRSIASAVGAGFVIGVMLFEPCCACDEEPVVEVPVISADLTPELLTRSTRFL
jgi:hypothetical protein